MSDDNRDTEPPTPLETPASRREGALPSPSSEPGPLHDFDNIEPPFPSPPPAPLPAVESPHDTPGALVNDNDAPLVIRRADLVRAGACLSGLVQHDARAKRQGRGAEDTVFPKGWTEDDAREVYARPDGSRQLYWLEVKGFVPRHMWPERRAGDREILLRKMARAMPGTAARYRRALERLNVAA